MSDDNHSSGRAAPRRTPAEIAVAYLAAPACVLLAAAIQYILLPKPELAPFVFFFFGVALASWIGGRGPGLVATAVSAVVANVLFLAPRGSWSIDAAAGPATLLFVLSASAVALLAGSLRAATDEARHAAALLEDSRARWKSVFDHAPVPLWEEDLSLVRARFDALRAAGVAELETHLAGAPDEVAALARLVRVTEISRAGRELFGLDAVAEVEAGPAAFHDDGLEVFRRELVALWRGATAFHAELPVRTGDGRRRHVELRLSVVPGHERSLRRVLLSFLDLTERREAEERLREADRRKDEFLAMLGHELRNPLSAIATATHLAARRLARGLEPGTAIGVLERQTRHASRLLDDLLDVSRVTRGLVELRRERVDLGEVVRHAAEAQRGAVEAAHHALEVVVPAAAAHVHGDPARLEQVIANLLGNAVKYTPPGGHLAVSLALDGRELVLSVKDDGVGMAPDLLPHVFEPFVQGRRSLAITQGGLGLGLALVKRIVELHGGSVEARSDGPDRGSELVVRLPSVDPGAERPEGGDGERAQPA